MKIKEQELFGSDSYNQDPGRKNAEPQQVDKESDIEIPCRTGGKQAQQVYRLLTDGNKYSVVDMVRILNIGDPRSVVRDIRNAGIEVCDEWAKSNEGNRYKRFWIKIG